MLFFLHVSKYVVGQPSREPTNPDYVPSIFCHRPIHEGVLQEKVQRHQRLVERKENKARNESAQALLTLSKKEPPVCLMGTSTQTPIVSNSDAEVQTDITLPVMTSLIITNQYLKSVCDANAVSIREQKQDQEKLQDICHEQEEELKSLKAQLKHQEEENKLLMEEINKKTLSFKNIQDDDRKTKFYTGFPNFNTLNAVFKETSPKVNRKRTKLPKEDELLLTLVKLRRNLAMTDLAYRFNISQSSVTNIFHAWLDALYSTLEGLVCWPETDVCQLPEVFQNEVFRRVKCVIDCTEIFIERPSNLKARAQTYSNYKRHNTIKILVGVSPTGCVTFLSTCWGGRVSDRQITCDSGFLDKLLPGDVVLADKGFNMTEDFTLKGAQLIVPAYTKGKSQLPKEDVEKSRMMSRARIHIERVIGRLKDFEIIKGPLPINLVKRKTDSQITAGDKIVRVVAAIVNTNDAIL